MKKGTRSILVAVTVAGLGLGAASASAFGPPGASGPRGGGWHGPSAQRMAYQPAVNLERMKQALDIRPEQEDAWQAFADAVKARSDDAFERRRQQWEARTAGDGLTFPDRAAAMEARQEQSAEVLAAAQSLYEALDPVQQRSADFVLLRGPRH